MGGRISILLGLMFLGFGVQAQSMETCSDTYESVGAFIYQRFQGEKNCYLVGTPNNNSVNFYRSPVLTDEGMFMVFNSYEFNKGTDGARVFYFFPRNHVPELSIVNGQAILKTATQGIEILIHPTQTSFAGMTGGILTEDPKVHPNNQGGVELSKIKTLWLDAGFKLKGDPTADLKGLSNFTDMNGKKCQVKNSEIFSEQGDGDSFLHFTDTELKTFLNKRCPQIYVNW